MVHLIDIFQQKGQKEVNLIAIYAGQSRVGLEEPNPHPAPHS